MTIQFNKEKLKKLCAKYNLALAVLHGSYAKGKTTQNSDIDIGLLGESKEIKKQYFNILKDFTEIFGDKFDPVFLNGAEAMITYHVALGGIPLYEKEKGMFNIFKTGAIARYQDTRKFRNLEKEYVKASIRGN